MKVTDAKIGLSGIALGTIALLIAVVSFWAGPFAPKPTVETEVAGKVFSLKKAVLKGLLSESSAKPTYQPEPKWNIDKTITVLIPVIAVFAMLLGLFSFINKEPIRVATGAAMTGLSAIAFQFIALYAFAIILVVVVIAVISALGDGF